MRRRSRRPRTEAGKQLLEPEDTAEVDVDGPKDDPDAASGLSLRRTLAKKSIPHDELAESTSDRCLAPLAWLVSALSPMHAKSINFLQRLQFARRQHGIRSAPSCISIVELPLFLKSRPNHCNFLVMSAPTTTKAILGILWGQSDVRTCT